MIGVLVALAAGYLAGAKGQAGSTPVKRYKVIGPRTGTIWFVEEFPSSGFLAIQRSPSDEAMTVVTYHRDPETGQLKFSQAVGSPHTIEQARSDFEP